MNYPQFMVEDILAPRHSAHKFMTSTDPEYEQKSIYLKSHEIPNNLIYTLN